MAKKKVVIGMSGGVDSSVAAWMLKEQGYDVVGLFMKNWEDDDDSEYCSTRQDWIDAASVADDDGPVHFFYEDGPGGHEVQFGFADEVREAIDEAETEA